MTDTNISFIANMAELSEAAYAKFNLFDIPKDALLDGDFAEEQADAFVDNWEIAGGASVGHIKNTETGFSATLFQSKADDSYIFAIRGTEITSIDDLATDALNLVDGLAFYQAIDMYNYWNYLTSPVNSVYQVAKLVISNPEVNDPNTVILGGLHFSIVFENP